MGFGMEIMWLGEVIFLKTFAWQTITYSLDYKSTWYEGNCYRLKHAVLQMCLILVYAYDNVNCFIDISNLFIYHYLEPAKLYRR